MVRRDVERVEVVPLVLDLGSLDDAVAHAGEDVDDLGLDDRERVERTAPERPSRQRDVDAVGLEALRLAALLQFGAAPLESGSQLGKRLVRSLADVGFRVGWKRPERALHAGDRRPSAEDRDLRLLERVERLRRGDQGPAALELLVEDANGIGRVHVRRV